jgi:glutamate---cysteine ligase / carboxylate-amine ligase
MMEFTPSDPRSIGVELELQLLDAESLDLADRIMPLLELFPDEPHVKPEFIQNTVEITSSVHHDLASLEAEFRQQAARLADRCRALGLRLAGAGTHPFSERLSLLTPRPRYLRMEETGGLLAHTQITFSTQVHLGMISGEEAVAIMRSIKPYLPLLIALSANSPFWRGYDTGYAAYRHRILAASRGYGVPPSFESWQGFVDLFGALQRAGLAENLRSLHWDIRPRPDFGTLEVRVMDAQSTLHEAVALAGFVRALVFFLRRYFRETDHPDLLRPLHWWLVKANHFDASRLGMEARLIVDERGGTRPLAEIFAALMEDLSPVADELGQAGHLDTLRRLAAEGPGYRRQWVDYEAGGSLQHVTANLAEALERELTPP